MPPAKRERSGVEKGEKKKKACHSQIFSNDGYVSARKEEKVATRTSILDKGSDGERKGNPTRLKQSSHTIW